MTFPFRQENDNEALKLFILSVVWPPTRMNMNDSIHISQIAYTGSLVWSKIREIELFEIVFIWLALCVCVGYKIALIRYNYNRLRNMQISNKWFLCDMALPFQRSILVRYDVERCVHCYAIKLWSHWCWHEYHMEMWSK